MKTIVQLYRGLSGLKNVRSTYARAGCIALALVFALGAPAAAAHWTAVSTTAIAITGDITFAPSRIVFANGTMLRLAFDRRLHMATWTGLATEGAPVEIYRVVRPANPVLLHGNRLCGALATYLSIVRPTGAAAGDANLVGMAVFAGRRPRAGQLQSPCATYTYESSALKRSKKGTS